MQTDIHTVMNNLSPYLDRFDTILRHGHAIYERYPPEIVVDHDASTQAQCTHRHILLKAHEELDKLPNVHHMESRGQNLWFFEDANAVCRFKKTDENGMASNYPTKQIKDFNSMDTLPGFPSQPTRLTVGYLLDETGTGFARSQVSLSSSKTSILWCAAIVPRQGGDIEDAKWQEVTRQMRLA